jgi:hypothetical protein
MGIFFGGKQVFFDGNLNAQVVIYRPVNRPHASLAQDFKDPISII